MTSNLPSSPRTALWSGGLAGLVLGGCLLVGCLEPLVAVAVIAAGALPLGRALLLTAAIWVAGQAIGFGFHDYPRDAQTISWGLGLGLAALISAGAAAAALAALPGKPVWLCAGAAFITAFFANQLMILGIEQVVTGACVVRPGVISTVGLINAAWLTALLALETVLSRFSWPVPAFGRPR